MNVTWYGTATILIDDGETKLLFDPFLRRNKTLKKHKVPEDRISVIVPGDEFSIGGFTIRVYHGKHVDFDGEHIRKVFLDCAVHLPLFLYYWITNETMNENDEIVLFEVENDGKRVLVMGSYGTDETVSYPKNVDMFVMPFGGSPKIKQKAMPFIDEICPKCIMADHHDNAFPPLTRRMDVEGFAYILMKSHPETEYIIPDEYKVYTV